MYSVWYSKACSHCLHEMACLCTGPPRGDPSGRWANDFYNVKSKQAQWGPCALLPWIGFTCSLFFLFIGASKPLPLKLRQKQKLCPSWDTTHTWYLKSILIINTGDIEMKLNMISSREDFLSHVSIIRRERVNSRMQLGIWGLGGAFSWQLLSAMELSLVPH